jgi:RNA polymerase sigma factor (sigma-70 family)
MDRTDWNSPQHGDAARSADPDYQHSGPEESDGHDRPQEKRDLPPIRDSFDDVSSPMVRQPSRSRPDTSLAFHGRMSERMSAILFEQIAIERSEIAFKEFYELLAPKVYSVIFRILRSEDDALDILQEVFTHFWNSAPELHKVHSNISAWILLLARNRAVDETRSYRFRTQHNTESYDDLEHDSLMADTHTPDEKLTDDAAKQEITKAFEVLNDEQKKIMQLVYFSGMTPKAVAEALHLSPGAVRKTIRSSVEKLRHAMTSEEPFSGTPNAALKKIEKRERVVKKPKLVRTITSAEAETNTLPKVKKAPKEKAAKAEPTVKKSTKAEGISRRAMKLHSILDDLMKNRENVLDKLTIPYSPTNTNLDQQ